MKRAILGALLGAGLVVVAIGLCGQRNEAFAQRTGTHPPTGSGNDLIAIPTTVGETQMLTVIDSQQQTVAVYRIGFSNGKITLLSVRNIHWDLQMTEFNGVNPLPREIRQNLEPR
jgi:hypothetical protein